MSKHTPGPWVAVTRTNAHIEIEAPSQPGYSAKKVATASLINHEANARLIAAAPDLLEALKLAEKRLIATCEKNLVAFNGEDVDTLNAIRAAIAKAEGEKA